MVIKTFKQLYKKTSTGAIQTTIISVVVDDDLVKVITKFGQVDGKIQESPVIIKEGKNIGKANETTAIEQAVLQAESDWKKKLKKGYVDNIEDAKNGVVDDIIGGGIFPMLAHKFSEQGHKIKYPAIAQPKLDGHRMTTQTENMIGNNCSIMYDYDARTTTSWSRTRKPINSVPHITDAVNTVMMTNERLDGELYNHDYKDNFEELTHFITQDKPLEGCEVVQYHVYDYPHPTMTNLERNKYLQLLKPQFEGTPVHIVESIIVNDEDELMAAFDHFIDLGYEGCMVRNCDGLYVDKRSYDLQKVKQFDDDEFLVVGVKEGKGTMAGKAIFICLVNDGRDVTFDAKMKGKLDDLKKYWEIPSLAIGRQLTVKYQGFTNKNKKPRFGVAVRFKTEL